MCCLLKLGQLSWITNSWFDSKTIVGDGVGQRDCGAIIGGI